VRLYFNFRLSENDPESIPITVLFSLEREYSRLRTQVSRLSKNDSKSILFF